MNKLDRKTLHLLCEGQSIRAVTRLTGCSKNAVAKLLVEAGHACAAYQDKVLRNLPCKRVQMDEIWKAANVKAAKAAPEAAGDVWTWTAICADTKLIVSWLLGARDMDAALAFTHDLESRLENRVQLTSDGHRPYLQAVEAAFSDQVDYAMLIKLYGADPQAEKVENHAAAIALHTMYYNFVRIHQTLKVTPAMAAGVTDKLWEMDDLVAMLEQWELANFKPEYQFVVRQYAIGKGHSVSVLWRGGEVDSIFGFEKESDALEWIREKSQAWLIERC